MLETKVVRITLVVGNVYDDELATKLNDQLRDITKKDGELKAYTLLSDYTNKAGTRFVTFLVTFFDLDSDLRISES